MKIQLLILFFASNLYVLGQAPNNISGLKLWYNADSVNIVGGKVTQIFDQSGLQNNAIQNLSSKQPIVINNVLNGKKSIRFTSTNEMDISGVQLNSSAPHTMYFVVSNLNSGNSVSTFFQIQSNGTYNSCYSIPSGTYKSSYGTFTAGSRSSNPLALFKSTNLYTVSNPNYFKISFDGSSSTNINSFNYFNNNQTQLKTAGTNGLSNNFSKIGCTTTNFSFIGDILEVIFFERNLSASENNIIESYLKNRYMPILELGPDILSSYGFQNYSLNASSNFQEYQWNTGETTSSIVINEPGQYWVQVKDRFGIISSDTINLTRPDYSVIQLSNQTICYNSNTSIAAQIPAGDYTFVQWSDGVTTQTRTITQTTNLNYTLKDNLNNTKTSNTATLTYDNTLQNVSLGNDTTLCEGNFIQLQVTSPSIITYLWSTNNTTPSITLVNSGVYSLEVSNSNGCSKNETIQVTIQGQSPTIQINFPTQFCLNESTPFSESSFVQNGEAIGFREWNFGNNTYSNLSSGAFVNSIIGDYNGTLTVTSIGGCRHTQAFSYSVRPKPTASYTSPLLCDNVSGLFTNISSAPSSTISTSQWLVDDILNASTINLNYAHPVTGNYNLKLIVTNGFGCKDTSSQTQSVINTYPIPNASSLIDPFNTKTVLSTEQIPFSWSSVADNYFYELQFSTSTSFNSILYSQTTTQINLTTALNNSGTIFWRVKANNPCLLGGTSQVFSIQSVTIADSLRLWLRADRGTTLNGSTVSSWLDQSQTNLNASQSTVENQPTFVSSNPVLNGFSSVQFDGTNDMLNGGLIPRINTNSLSVFAVASGGNQSTTNAVLLSSGSATSGWWLSRRASAGRIGVLHNNNTLQGATATLPTSGYNFRLFGYKKVFGNSALLKVNGTNEISSTAAVAINGFTNANYQVGAGSGANFLNGDIAEVMVFTKTLSTEEQTGIEKYLMDKYTKPVNIGPDISMNYGFCDITLTSNAFFESYIWNTGASTSSIEINEPGQYWVQTVDVFGRTSRDTVNVFRPIYNQITLQNELVCASQPEFYSAPIPSGAYTFVSWSDGVTTATRTISSAQSLSYTIQDNGGCQRTSNVAQITVDATLVNMSLGQDTSLCAGNAIGLVQNLVGSINYSWNTGNTQPTQIADTSGTYILQVSNSNGCQKSDEIAVVVVGVAPTLDFYISPQACQGGTFTFWDSSTVVAPSTISSTVWHFQNQQDFIGTNGTVSYQDSGFFTGSIEVTTFQGCSNSANFSIYSSPLPILEIKKSYSCTPGIIELTGVNATGLDIATYDWSITQNGVALQSSLDTVLFTLNSNNELNVQLSVVDELACSNQISTIFPLAAENTIQLTTPSNNVTLSSGDGIPFSWTDLPFDSISTDYTIEIASDSLFVNLVHQQTISQSNLIYSPASLSGFYFWRVKRCYSQNWSHFTKFNIVNISNGQRLWLRSDSLQILGGKIAQWYDRSGNGFHAIQNTVSSRPTLASISPNIAHPAVKFDGIDDFLIGQTIPGINNSSMTAFILVNGYNQTDNGGLLTIGTLNQGFGLYRGTLYQKFTMLTNYATNSLVFDIPDPMPNAGFPFKLYGMTKNFGVNVQMHGNGVTGSTNTVPSLVGSFTNANYQISGGELSKLNGEIAEVILYDQALPTSQRNEIERYLMDRYAPPVNLGADINSTYGFCDITLLPTNQIYTSYLWSNNATSSSIAINEPGTYWVQAVDVFGRTSRDTIQVFRPVFDEIALNDEAICFGQSETLIAPIPSDNYTFFQWSDGLTNPIRIIDTVQTLSFTIEDSLGCQRSSNLVQITIDSSLIGVSLGNDTTLCAGNSIALETTPTGNLNYLWNTLNTSSSQIIDTSGTYIVQVSNQNACSNSDEIYVEIIGIAPTLNFDFPTEICQGLTVNFSDSSTVPLPNEINEIVWHIENQPDYFGASGSININESGTFQCELEVSTVEGCNNIANFELTVFPKPIISFTTEKFCPNEFVVFNPVNSISTQISNFNWLGDSGNFSSTSTNPTYLFGVAGNYTVTLNVEDQNGCKDTVVQNINIQEGPLVDFSITNPCEKQTVEFLNGSTISDTLSISSYQWNTSDGASSADSTFNNVFSEYGDYQVSLVANANNGCRDTIEKTITIHPIPILEWELGPACKNTWTTFENQSTIPLGSISQTEWLVNLQYLFEGTSSAYKFVTTGVQYLNLTSTSDQNCTSDTLIIVNVNPELDARFNYLPLNIVSGVPVTFSDLSIASSSSTWDMGIGEELITYTPPINQFVKSYPLEWVDSTIDVTLFVENQIGCKDTISKSFTVQGPAFDLEVKSVFVQEINGFNTIGVEFENKGTIAITSVNFQLSSLNSLPIQETWAGNLLANQDLIYMFNAKLSAYNSTQDDLTNFLCVEGFASDNLGNVDIIITNNKVCENTENEEIALLSVAPNPTENTTNISLLIPNTTEATNLNVSLYSMNGAIVKYIIKDQSLEAGIFDFNVDLTNVQLGIYLLKIEDGTTSKVIRLSKI